jgi:dephospho-CoA kinase
LDKIQTENLDDILVIAITGGLGTGKSTVSKLISKNGYPIINTDLLAKKIISRSKEIQQQIIQNFGNNSIDENGNLNSLVLSKLVFGEKIENKKNLELLNSIIHPPVIDEMIKEIEELAKNNHKIIFVESALIFEANLEDGFDYIIVVDAPIEKRIEWFKKRTNLTEKEFFYIQNSQLSQDFKKNNADFVIENYKTTEELEKSVNTLLNIIKILPKNEKIK